MVGGHRRLARRGRAARPGRRRPVSIAVAEGARRPRGPDPPPPAHVALHGGAIRLERPAHHHRRRRAPGQSPVPRHGRIARHVRVGRPRAADRVAGPAGHHARRLRREPRAAPPGQRHPSGAAARRGHAGPPGGCADGGRQLTPGRALRRGRRVAPVPRGRAPRHRPPAQPSRGRGQRARSRVRLSARPGAGRGRRRPGPGRAPGRPHGAARLLPGGAHRPGAAHLDVGTRRTRRCVRAVSLLGAPAFAAGGRRAAPTVA